jgi:hypothetical protein
VPSLVEVSAGRRAAQDEGPDGVGEGARDVGVACGVGVQAVRLHLRQLDDRSRLHDDGADGCCLLSDDVVQPEGDRSAAFLHDVGERGQRCQRARRQRVVVGHHGDRGARAGGLPQLGEDRRVVGVDLGQLRGHRAGARRREAGPASSDDRLEDVVAADRQGDQPHVVDRRRVPVPLPQQRDGTGQLTGQQRRRGRAADPAVVEHETAAQCLPPTAVA